MSQPDGGPAFPRQRSTLDMAGSSGMSLRDWFAGQALNAIAPHEREGRDDEALAAEYARQAYLMADAMLKARREQS